MQGEGGKRNLDNVAGERTVLGWGGKKKYFVGGGVGEKALFI